MPWENREPAAAAGAERHSSVHRRGASDAIHRQHPFHRRDAESAARSGGRLVRMSLREYVYMVRRLVVVHAHDIYLVDLVSGRLVVIHAVRLRVYIFIYIYICVILISICSMSMYHHYDVCNAV